MTSIFAGMVGGEANALASPVPVAAGAPTDGPSFTSTPARAAPGSAGVIAGIVLFVLGAAMAIFGTDLVGQGLAHGDGSGGVREAMVGLGGLLLVVGAFHLVAAARLWGHGNGSARLALGIAVIGLALAAIPFYLALRSELQPSEGSVRTSITGFLFVIPYLAVLTLLFLDRRRERRSERTSGTDESRASVGGAER